jgi:methylenetetrahydrofolate dehydrogenase (NADP+)/methenyltetrahydrofolate cyclohydrolase
MAQANLLDGNKRALLIKSQIAGAAQRLLASSGIRPGLAAVQVGDNPASKVYVRNKIKAAHETGIASFEHRLPASTSREDLLGLIRQLNEDRAVSGILVQLPLPAHLDANEILLAISPDKDVDGFHPLNAGRLMTGLPGFVACTPLGCLMLIKQVRPELSGLNAVIIGRSNIVGKPMALLLLQQNCTVTVAHSRTRDLPSVARGADILVAAVGRAHFVKGDWVKQGAIVIDVGINRVEGEGGKAKLVGDVDFAEAASRASAITPVPGGVGPMTVACLMVNTLKAAHLQHGLPWSDEALFASESAAA